MPGQDSEGFAGRSLPDSHAAVMTSGGEEIAVDLVGVKHAAANRAAAEHSEVHLLHKGA